MPAPAGKGRTWKYVQHALGEFNVEIEEFEPEAGQEGFPKTYILIRVVKGKTHTFAGSFEPNERLTVHVLKAICRILNLRYETVFGEE